MRKLIGLLAALLFSVPTWADPGGLLAPGQPLIIDVRTADEYRAGHVQDAINIPYDEIAGRIAAVTPDHDARIVLYCRSGRRSGIAEQALRQMGYRQIENKGGLNDMLQNGYQIARETVVCQAGSTAPCDDRR